MSSYPSSLILKRNIDCQIWQQLTELWQEIASYDETQLFTEDTLIKLLENEPEKCISSQLETDKFFLLITPKFSAFLCQSKNVAAQTCEVSAIFDPAVITDKLIQFGYEHGWNTPAINSLRLQLETKLVQSRDSSTEFVFKAVKLLIDNAQQPEHDRHQYFNPQSFNLTHYQVQEKIFEQIQIQVSKNVNLSEIIQTAINLGCDFLQSDRLLVYQLGVPLKSSQKEEEADEIVDTITYEARKSHKVISTLYLQEGGCWGNNSECRNKYRQGFGLVINNLSVDAQLNPCLQGLMDKLQVKAKIVIPIAVKGQLWGMIIAHQSQPRIWQHQDVQFIRQMAEYLAIAIFDCQSYQQLQEQKQLLEKQVEIQYQQLKDALIAAEAASKSKHDFLGSMSHELRTPLTCVIGLSSTLLQWSSAKQKVSLSPEKQQKYLHLIQQSGRQLLSLINNILEFSDVESGKHLLEIKQVSLRDIMQHSVNLLQESAKEKNIDLRLEINIKPEKNTFFADEIRLREIIFHILHNAIKFTSAGGIVILRLWREQRQVIFQIEDTGIGIAPTEIPLLFEKFKQIANVHQRVHGGTGLGLALTKKLIELHGGTIEVESALDEGSIFTVYLPENEPQKLHQVAAATLFSSNAASSQTIVLITEDEACATFICQLLNTIDYKVVWLMDSAMAVGQIELLKPRIVIIDRDCSIADVENIVHAIAHASLDTYTKVSLLCDRFEHDEWQKFTKCGVDEYLLKSMNPSQIIQKIDSLSQKAEDYEQLQDG